MTDDIDKYDSVPVVAGFRLSERQYRIFQWLNSFPDDGAFALGELFFGACRMLSERPRGWPRFVGHAIREIVNRLPEVLTGRKWPPRLDYPNELSQIDKLWGGIEHQIQATIFSDQNIMEIPIKIVIALDGFIDKHRQASNTNQDKK